MQFAFSAAWPMSALVPINLRDITFTVRDHQWTNDTTTIRPELHLKHHLPVIIGIIIGAILVATISSVLCCCYKRRRDIKRWKKEEDRQTLIELQSYKIPSTWDMTENGTRAVVPFTSDEYMSIYTRFDKVMKKNYTQIIQIERVQNERWYKQYTAHSEDFQKRLGRNTEKQLYHGCTQEAANSIIDSCFNRSFAGVNGVVYGVGVYFSTDATYSHNYAIPNPNGERCMFVARVLVGNTIFGNSSMKTPPDNYDSTTDNKHIFVTYHDAQALAEYLITYK
ncbi:unnamed protein product [Adineta ricciae]|uniref:Poly [ADP-ribose] polymerase n=1 Tax=Adineta ricciae TaxID=249248 RepID=A0A813T685_ADIRI|nr:unnamed protein product [Adineta ricciae]CAF1380122.1 unnamed protein product [Adineta ricciae]